MIMKKVLGTLIISVLMLSSCSSSSTSEFREKIIGNWKLTKLEIKEIETSNDDATEAIKEYLENTLVTEQGYYWVFAADNKGVMVEGTANPVRTTFGYFLEGHDLYMSYDPVGLLEYEIYSKVKKLEGDKMELETDGEEIFIQKFQQLYPDLEIHKLTYIQKFDKITLQ